MTMFLTNPYFIITQRFECYTTLIAKELLYNKKSNISKSVVTYITICVTNTSNNTIKQYYGIKKNVQSSSYCQKEIV